MRSVDLNADVGEWDGPGVSPGDAVLIPLVTSVNVACGGHSGNEAVMGAVVAFAASHGVAVGAHPGFVDREHFGRRELTLTAAEIDELIRTQVAVLRRVAASARVVLRHVKPHGALYNLAARDPGVATAVAGAVASVDPALVLVGLAGSRLIEAGRQVGLRTAAEAFADRAYEADGSLAVRGSAGAVLEDARLVADRAVRIIRDRSVHARDGRAVSIDAQTICIHGDTPGAARLARAVRDALAQAGIEVSAIR